MRQNFYSIQVLAIFVLIFTSCNGGSQSDDKVGVDSTTLEQPPTHTTGNTGFDVSRNVIAISPNLYKILSDTLNIRMLEGTYKPGDSSIMHAHPDFALYVLEGSTVELTAEDGSRQNIEFKKDMAVILPATTHSAKNIGKSTLRLVVVEVNRPRN